MITKIIEQLEQLPYEEWLTEIEVFLENDVDLCHRVLMHLPGSCRVTCIASSSSHSRAIVARSLS